MLDPLLIFFFSPTSPFLFLWITVYFVSLGLEFFCEVSKLGSFSSFCAPKGTVYNLNVSWALLEIYNMNECSFIYNTLLIQILLLSLPQNAHTIRPVQLFSIYLGFSWLSNIATLSLSLFWGWVGRYLLWVRHCVKCFSKCARDF